MPMTFDASLSDYETLMKVVAKANETVDEVNTLEYNVQELQVQVNEQGQDINELKQELQSTNTNLQALYFNYTPAYTNLKITIEEKGQISWAQQNDLFLVPANAQSGNALNYAVNSGSVTVTQTQRLYLYLLANSTGISQVVTSNNPPLTINLNIQSGNPNYFALGFIDGFNSVFVPYACYYINNKMTYPYENLNNTTLLDELHSTVDNLTTQIAAISSQLTTTTNTANSALSTATNAQADAGVALSTANDAATSVGQIANMIDNLKTNFVPPYMPSFTLSITFTDYTSAQQIVPITFADEQNARSVTVSGSNAGVTGNAYLYIQVNTQTNQGTIINSNLSPSEIYSMNIANTKFAPIAYLATTTGSNWTYIPLATYNNGEKIVTPYENVSA